MCAKARDLKEALAEPGRASQAGSTVSEILDLADIPSRLLIHDRSWDIPQMTHGLRRAKLITAVSKPPVVAMARQFIRAVASLALLLSLSAPTWAGFREGVAAFKRGDYATALREWRPLAEQGHAKAQNNLGVMYNRGRGVPQDYAEAVRWYRKAAEQGYANAQLNLSRMYHLGQGLPRDYAQAMKWYRKAAEQGNIQAQNALGFMYEQGQGVPKDYAKALRWLRMAAAQGNKLARDNVRRIEGRHHWPRN